MVAVSNAAQTALSKARAVAWKSGVLTFKLDAAQRILHREVMERRQKHRVILIAGRGWGKTFLAVVMCLEHCIRNDGHQVAFVSGDKTQAERNLRFIVDKVLEGCPGAMRPEFIKAQQVYRFPNGSLLFLLGVNSERYESIRGATLQGIWLDEAQSVDELDHTVRAILEPTVLRCEPSGWFVISGTAPRDASHDLVSLVAEARGLGQCITKTTPESPRYTPKKIQEMCDRAGGPESQTWKREYLVDLTAYTDTRVVVPEWAARAASLTRVSEAPPYFDRYVGMDSGVRDLTVVLLGYWDFKDQSLRIQRELVFRGAMEDEIAKAVKAAELELWGEEPPRRFADNDLRLLIGLQRNYGLHFQATDKRDKPGAISALRLLIQNDKLVVDPSCVLLIKTLHAALYSKTRKEYDRDDEIGHADALDALLYLLRNVNRTRNPYPDSAGWKYEDGRIKRAPTASVQALKTALQTPMERRAKRGRRF